MNTLEEKVEIFSNKIKELVCLIVCNRDSGRDTSILEAELDQVVKNKKDLEMGL